MPDDANTLTPESGTPITHAAGEPAFLTRARRILSGNIRPDDYLPVTPEVTTEVSACFERLSESKRVPSSEEGIQLLRHDATLQFHWGGREVLCRRTPLGVIVLASSAAEIDVLFLSFPPEGLPGYVVEYPHPWN